jgi:integrase
MVVKVSKENIMALQAVKNPNYKGIFINKLKSGDEVFYINYKDINNITVKARVGSKRLDNMGLKKAYEILQAKKKETNKERENQLFFQKQKDSQIKTISQLAEKFFKQRNTKNNHKDQQKYINHLDPLIGKIKLLVLSPSDITTVQQSLKLSPKSINIITDLLKSMFNYAINENIYPHNNPISQITRFKEDNNRMRILSDKEIELLLNDETINSNKMTYLLLNLALYTAARPAAILEIRVMDISNGNLTLKAMKGNNSLTIPIHETLQELLDNWIIEQSLAPSNYIFFPMLPSINKNKPLAYESIRNKLRPVFDRLFNQGISTKDSIHRVSLYTLRHTAGTKIAASSDALIAQRLLGHADLKTTARYVKFSDNTLKDVINEL